MPIFQHGSPGKLAVSIDGAASDEFSSVHGQTVRESSLCPFSTFLGNGEKTVVSIRCFLRQVSVKGVLGTNPRQLTNII